MTKQERMEYWLDQEESRQTDLLFEWIKTGVICKTEMRIYLRKVYVHIGFIGKK